MNIIAILNAIRSPPFLKINEGYHLERDTDKKKKIRVIPLSGLHHY
jgi:hypothetical protein